MFSGIVTKMVPVVQKDPFAIRSEEPVEVGESIAIGGVCLTVTKQDGDVVFFDVVQETLDRTTLGALCVGESVNYERSLRYGDRVGGHMVTGHVYCRGLVVEAGPALVIEVPHRFFYEKGWIALDGVSLTVAKADQYVHIALIPETMRKTSLGAKTIGQWVNVEYDGMVLAIKKVLEDV